MEKMKQMFKPIAHSSALSAALLLLRLLVGAAFVLHGWGKIQHPFDWMQGAPVPGVLQFLAAFAEFGGGIALVLGLLTPLASAGLIVTMFVATLMVAVMMKAPFTATKPGELSYELSTVYFFIAVLLLFAGPGKYSLDAKIFGQRPNLG